MTSLGFILLCIAVVMVLFDSSLDAQELPRTFIRTRSEYNIALICGQIRTKLDECIYYHNDSEMRTMFKIQAPYIPTNISSAIIPSPPGNPSSLRAG